MKGKIIISTKPPKEYLQDKSTKDKENGSQKVKDSSSFELVWGKEVSDLKQHNPEDFDEVKFSCSQLSEAIILSFSLSSASKCCTLIVDVPLFNRMSKRMGSFSRTKILKTRIRSWSRIMLLFSISI